MLVASCCNERERQRRLFDDSVWDSRHASKSSGGRGGQPEEHHHHGWQEGREVVVALLLDAGASVNHAMFHGEKRGEEDRCEQDEVDFRSIELRTETHY